MRIAIDLDDRTIRTWAGQGISSLTFKRRDRFPVEVRFMRGGVAQELPTGAAGKIGLKADKDFNGQFVASHLAWTKLGAGISATYVFDLNLNTIQINALFACVPTPSSVVLMLEIEWAEGDLRTSSNTLAVTLENDIVRGDEGIPEEGSPVYPPPPNILSIANLATATIVVGQDSVDFDISGLAATPSLCVPLGIQKPNHEADNISILSAFPVSATTLRAYLTAAPSEPGYKATVLFR
ncbi:MAG: hypothetical protein WCO94_06035 [Verrucomicrobiota bacterium]